MLQQTASLAVPKGHCSNGTFACLPCDLRSRCKHGTDEKTQSENVVRSSHAREDGRQATFCCIRWHFVTARLSVSRSFGTCRPLSALKGESSLHRLPSPQRGEGTNLRLDRVPYGTVQVIRHEAFDTQVLSPLWGVRGQRNRRLPSTHSA